MIKAKNNLAQSRPNQTPKNDKNYCNHCQSVILIPTLQQLSIFTNSPTPDDDPPAYSLQIKAIPYQERVKPNNYRKLNIPGQFSCSKASEILKIIHYWDWELDRDRIPKCAERWRNLFDEIFQSGTWGGEANA